MDLGELKVRISANIAELSAGLQRAHAQVQQAGEKMQRVGSSMQSVGAKMSLGVTAPILLMGRMGVEKLGEIEKANAQTAASLARIGAGSLVSVEGVHKLSESLEKKSGIDAQVIQSGENMLLTLGAIDTRTKTGAKTFTTATRSVVDYAEAMGVNASSAAKLYAKSLAAASEGTLLLPRGVKLGASAMQKLTAEFKAAKTPGERQALVAEALGKKFAGAAKLTSTEKWTVLHDQLATLAASVVQQLMPAASKVIAKLGEWTEKFDSMSPATKKIIAIVVAVAAVMGPLIAVVGTLVGALGVLAAAEWAAILPIAAIIVAIVAVIAIGVLLYKNWDTIKAKCVEAWDAVKSAVSTAINAVSSAITSAWNAIKTTTQSVWNAISGFFTNHMALILSIITGPIGAIAIFIYTHWDEIKAKTAAIWNAIKEAITSAISDAVAGIKGAAAGAWSALSSAFASTVDKAHDIGGSIKDAVLDGVRAIGNGIKGAAAGLAGSLWDALQAMVSKAADVGTAIGNAIKAGINAVIEKIRGFTLPSVEVAGKKIGGGHPFSDLPTFARGGVASSASIFGEAGREAAVPLGSSAQATADRNRVMREAGLSGGGGDFVFNIHGAVPNPFVFAQQAKFALTGAM